MARAAFRPLCGQTCPKGGKMMHDRCQNPPRPQGRIRQPRLPQGARRLRAHPHPAALRGLRGRPGLRLRGPRGGQHLRLHRFRDRRIFGRDRRGAGAERPSDRHRLPRRRSETHPRPSSPRAQGDGPARLRGCRHRGAPAPAAEARPVRRPRAAAGPAADAAALRVSEDLRGLQQQVQLLHHPRPARQAREPAHR